ncbi:MAG: hypothetical protein ACE14V_16230 [bacterium]
MMAKKKANKGNAAESKPKKQHTKHRLLNFVILFISLAVIVYLLGSFHYIKATDNIWVIHKEQFGFQNTYLDIRKWSSLDLFYHPEIVRAIKKDGGETLLNQIKKGLTQVDE